MEFLASFKNSLYKGYINDDIYEAPEWLNPKLIINDADRGEKVLTSISDELKRCDSFFFSVAFVTNSGVTALYNSLEMLEKKNIRGIIIASQYQNFSEPSALRKLLKLKNIELRIVPDDRYQMHVKAYIFKNKDEYSLIVGSSNLTQSALCVNQEWNIKVSSTEEGSIVKQSLKEFDFLKSMSVVVDEDWIATYEKIYKINRATQNVAQEKILQLRKVVPNAMQKRALEELAKTREEGHNKALVISATGTGKTYLSAFDVCSTNPKRFLFVVHREIIATEAMRSFKKVLGEQVPMAVLGGRQKDTNAEYLFSTIQTLSKDDVLHSFEPDTFDYIVIDEVHRSGAASYQKILNYFSPKFLLGMSATPERTDGYDVYKLFNHNVAYEIRLQHAMRENMVCPFHYFGISDMTVNGEIIDDQSEFRHLEADERVKNIIEKAENYGHSGARVKGLIFCSRNEEAIILSDKFNQYGYNTVALSGKDNNEDREKAIGRLEQNELENKLDYIFTVDIFNEGVDIPAINQVIMLRPTQSAIIFVQQLGRGLRNFPEKEFVVVLDFIGNYEKNFFIPVALSGDRSYNKDNLRRFVIEGNRTIPGASTVNFDEIARNKIFTAIDTANFNDVKSLKESYFALKMMLGKIPKLSDYDKYGSIDPLRFFDNKSIRSYHRFLKKYEKEYQLSFSSKQEEILEFVSKKLAEGKRPHELLLLELIIENKKSLFARLKKQLLDFFDIELTDIEKTSVINVMTNQFPAGSSKNTYANCIFIKYDGKGDYIAEDDFSEMLKDPRFTQALQELIAFGLERYIENFSQRYQNTNFQLYQKYTYEDACRLLNWEKNEVPLNIGGYKFDKKTNTYPVFINYHKDDDVTATINYEDRFISQSELIAISKSGRNVKSEDVVMAFDAPDFGIQMHLFVRKNKDDKISKEFYYLGFIEAYGEPVEFTMKNTNKTAVEIHYRLQTPVRKDIYDYVVD